LPPPSSSPTSSGLTTDVVEAGHTEKGIRMKRLAHVLIAVATGIEQASLVWESLKSPPVQPSQPSSEGRQIGFNPPTQKENTDLREIFARDA